MRITYDEEEPTEAGSDRAFGCTVGSILMAIGATRAFVAGSPEDAFRWFMGTDIDLLVAGNCIARKKDQDPALRVDHKGMFEPN
jgi:hypothetical protein